MATRAKIATIADSVRQDEEEESEIDEENIEAEAPPPEANEVSGAIADISRKIETLTELFGHSLQLKAATPIKYEPTPISSTQRLIAPMQSTPHNGGEQQPLEVRRKTGRPLNWSQKFGKKPDGNITDYITRFETYAKGTDWNEANKLSSFLATLQGRASRIVSELGPNATWDQVMNALRTKYDSESRKEALREQFSERVRQPKETLEDFLQDLQELVQRAHSKYPTEIQDDQVLARFIKGQPENIRKATCSQTFRDADEAMAAFMKYEIEAGRTTIDEVS